MTRSSLRRYVADSRTSCSAVLRDHYRALHGAVWPGVEAALRAAHIRN